MKLLRITLLAVIAIFLASCAKEGMDITIKPGTPSWKISKQYSYAYEHSKSRGERIALAEKGTEYADKCISEEPENPACYFYHALNVGHYYQSKVVGYQKGLERMVEDCNKVIKLKPSYASGGGYRVLGQIYTEVPVFTLRSSGIIRDLDRAINYLLKAIDYGPKYPENYISIATAYLKAGRKEDATIAIIKAKRFLPKWKGHDDYNTWKKVTKKLSKKLKRHIKNLQSRM
jgi:tetratricopeptide (TPR) repeat protein